MKAFCKECGHILEPGFTTIVTPQTYECDESGSVTEMHDDFLPDWADGAEFYGWWCRECSEWYNEGVYQEAVDQVEEQEESSWERLAGMMDDDGEFHGGC